MFKVLRLFLFVLAFLTVNRSFSQFPYTETFMEATASDGIVFGGDEVDPAANGFAFLTADASSPYNTSPDPAGKGYLRLTNILKYQKGYIYNKDLEIPSANGLKIEFEYFSYGGTGADGICFFLYDKSIPSFNIGGFGGSLGYAQYKKDDLVPPAHSSGVSGGYIGIGLDEYGYFARTFEGRSAYLDGTPVYTSRLPGSVVIRGKGNGNAIVTENYPLLTYKMTSELTSPFNLIGNNSERKFNQSDLGYRRASILLERNPAGGFNISVDILTGNGTPTPTLNKVINKFHYVEAAPERLCYGISSSSGNNTNYHEIRNLKIELYDNRPIGLSDIENTQTNKNIAFDVLNNDPSKGPGIVIIKDVNSPKSVNGGEIEVVNEENGIIKYTPPSGFSGTDQFTYKLSDINTGIDSYPITVTVNVYPTGTADNGSTTINTPLTLNVKENDPAKDGTSVNIATNPISGTVSVDPVTNNIVYTPNNSFTGTDSFTYTLKTADGLSSDPITANVTVLANMLIPAKIGLAKALTAVEKQVDGSFILTYRFTVVNAGEITVDNLSLTDDLLSVFTDTDFEVRSINAQGLNLIPNLAYDGKLIKELLNPTSLMLPMSKDHIDIQVWVAINKDKAVYENWAVISGTSTGDGKLVSDESTNGLSPDPIIPGDFSPNEKTPVTLEKGNVFIPEGFSPNNDGINDKFVIRNTSGKPIHLEIYNRWGNIVYKSGNYQNDWDGRCNQGIYFGEDVPSGTYYYIVNVEADKKIGFITISR